MLDELFTKFIVSGSPVPVPAFGQKAYPPPIPETTSTRPGEATSILPPPRTPSGERTNAPSGDLDGVMVISASRPKI